MRILVAGNGGFGREVRDWLACRNISVWNFIDDKKDGCIKVDDYEPQEDQQVIMAVGDPRGKEDFVARLNERKAVWHGLLWHFCPPTVHVGGGCVTCPGSIISSQARVGAFVHLNLYATVGHDVTVGDFCTLSSHVDLCGHVSLGTGVFVGSGARVMPGVRVGDYARIGAGATVHRDVPPGATIYAAPGRRL